MTDCHNFISEKVEFIHIFSQKHKTFLDKILLNDITQQRFYQNVIYFIYPINYSKFETSVTNRWIDHLHKFSHGFEAQAHDKNQHLVQIGPGFRIPPINVDSTWNRYRNPLIAFYRPKLEFYLVKKLKNTVHTDC